MRSQARHGTRFLSELKRRGVIETAVAYAVLGWLLLQVADVAFGQLSLPSWIGTFVAYLVVVGFPIAIVLAWFLKLTARGPVFDDSDTDSQTADEPFHRPSVAIVGALVLASLGVFTFDRYIGLPSGDEQPAPPAVTASTPIDPNSIAVLPFFNITGTDEGRIFSDGLTEDVINRLARVPGLLVSSRGDSYSLAPNSMSENVRSRLRVAYYIEGSVRVTSDMLRVVVQLIDSETGFHLVSRSFDRAWIDFFEIQDEITKLAVANMRVALPEATRAALDAPSSDANLDAYLLYRRGMDALYEPPTASTIARALNALEEALTVDPDYAAAHAGICMSRVAEYELTSNTTLIGAAEQACSEALDLNPNLDVVHNALGELYAQTGRYEAAAEAFDEALTINVKAVSALLGLGNVYLSQQRLAEAEDTFRAAVGLQPGNWNAYNALGSFFFLNGRYREAAREYREVVSLDIDNVAGWVNLAAAAMLSGDLEQGVRASARSVEIEPTREAYSNLGLLQYFRGDIDDAVASLEAAVEMAPNDYLAWSNLGDALSFSGTPDRAEVAFARAKELAEARLQINARDGFTIGNLAWIEAMLGNLEEAWRLIQQAQSTASSDPQVNYINALILALRDEPDAAVEQLATAVAIGYPRALIAAEPRLRALRGHAEFERLITDVTTNEQGAQ